ncbi:MAG: DUF4491 family protein [Aquificae bacterium]|nr:DUF4491 family protein [Aquificota bacterium]
MLADILLKYWKIFLGLGIILAIGGLFIPNDIASKIVEFTGFAILALTAYVLGYKMATDEAEKYIRSEMEKLAKRDIRYKVASEKMIKNLKGRIG